MAFRAKVDLSEYRRAKRKTLTKLKKLRNQAVKATLLAGQRQAKALARKRTGQLRRGIEVVLDVASVTSISEGSLVASAEYASFVEAGTRPHEIWARRPAYALHFFWRGQWRFFAKVNHPGTKPYPFMGPAYLKMERMLPAELERRFVGLQLDWD